MDQVIKAWLKYAAKNKMKSEFGPIYDEKIKKIRMSKKKFAEFILNCGLPENVIKN